MGGDEEVHPDATAGGEDERMSPHGSRKPSRGEANHRFAASIAGTTADAGKRYAS
jgi:hypothetical protein